MKLIESDRSDGPDVGLMGRMARSMGPKLLARWA